MLNKMKYKIIIKLILLWMFYSVSVVADTRKVESCLVPTTQKCNIKLTYFEENIDVTVGVSKDATYNEEYMELLNQYYLYAKANNLKELISLYDAGDGSLALIKESIRKVPTRYSRFHSVAEVKLNKVIKYGEYLLVVVSWHGKNGELLANWNELLVCNNQCRMSELLMHSNDDVSFMVLSASGSEMKTLEIKGDTLSVVHPKVNEFSASVEVAYEMFNKMTVDDREIFKNVSILINTVKSNFKQVGVLSNENMELWQDLLLNIFSRYWNDFNENVFYYYPSEKEADNNFYGVGYFALATEFNNIEKLVPQAKIQGNNSSFLIYSAVKASKSKLLIFSVDETGMVISQAELNINDGILAQLLQHPYVYGELKNRLINTGEDLISDNLDLYSLNIKEIIVEIEKNKNTETVVRNDKDFFVWLITGSITFIVLVFGFIFLRRKAS
jgi:hypothetical protein